MENITKEVFDKWNKQFLKGNRKTLYGRAVIDVFNKLEVTIEDIEEFISIAEIHANKKTKNKLTELEYYAMKIYNSILLQIKYALEEDVSESTQGQIFLLKAKYKYEDKSTVKIEEEFNVEDVITKSYEDNLNGLEMED